MEQDINDFPELKDAIENCAKQLIEVFMNSTYQNPVLNCELNVSDGTKYRLLFERVDLDEKGDHND